MTLRPHHWVVVSAWTSKLITAVIQIAIIRIIISKIGLNLYAGLALLTGLAGWYVLADFGIGNSLQNFIAERRARGESANELIITSLLLGIIIMALLMLLLYFSSPVLGPLLFKSIAQLDNQSKESFFWLFGALSLAGAACGLVYKIWYATQKGYLANILPAVGSIIGFAIIENIPDVTPVAQLMWCLVALTAPTVLLTIPALMYYIVTAYRRGGRPSVIHATLLIRRASRFMGLAIMAAVVLQIDYIVISQYLPTPEIAVYNISTRIFNTAFFVYYSVLLAFWPIFTELIAKNKWQKIVVKIKTIVAGGILFMCAVTIVVLRFEGNITGFLAPGASLHIENKIIVLLGIYFVVRIWTDIFSTVLASMSQIRVLLIWVPVQAALNICLQVYLAPRFGLIGVIAGLILAYLLTVAWVLPLQVLRLADAPLKTRYLFQ
jgi:O-antigen/teichoic acid export membrane protein